MEIHLSKKIHGKTFEDVESAITEKLKEQGFGIITEIDVKSTFKQKLDIDFRKYKILGACNPSFAYKAISSNDKVGVLLPCNVCVQELPGGEIEIFAINPMEAMKAVENQELKELSKEVTERLKIALDSFN